jgi:hypothetical protein
MPQDSLKGLAVVRVKSKRVKDESFRQAVVVGGGDARFVGLDDFGGVAFVFSFQGDRMSLEWPGKTVEASSKKLKRLLSLHLGKADFIAILTHERPEGWILRRDHDVEIWNHPRHKKLSVTFSDFSRGPVEPYYPRRIVIAEKDHLFDLKWLNVELQPSS